MPVTNSASSDARYSAAAATSPGVASRPIGSEPADRVVQLGFDLQARVGEMAFSPAVNFHAAIYQRRPDVEAIVHLHSHHVSVLSSTGRTIGMYNVASVLFHEDQATFADDGRRSRRPVALVGNS